MEILIQITAPEYGKRNEYEARAAQFERNELGNMVKLLATRIEMGTPSGEIASQDGKAILAWKIEQSSPSAAETEAA